MSRRDETAEELAADVSGLGGWRPARHRADVTVARVPSRRVTIRLDDEAVREKLRLVL